MEFECEVLQAYKHLYLLLQRVKNRTDSRIPVFCLIRARGGDFLYSPDEVAAMADDVASLAAAGADGFVIGALNKDGSVDEDTCRTLIGAAPAKTPFTFHRAFDMAGQPFEALKAAARLGCTRLLSSGQRRTAPVLRMRRMASVAIDGPSSRG